MTEKNHFWKEPLPEISQDEIAEILEETERVEKELAEVHPSPEYMQRLLDINQRVTDALRKQEKRKQKRARRYKYIAAAAVFLIAMGVVLAQAPPADAFRWKLYDILFSQEDEYSKMQFSDTLTNGRLTIENDALRKQAEQVLKRDGYLLYPAKLPKGYGVTDISTCGKTVRIKISDDGKENEVLFYYADQDIRSYDDNENLDGAKYTELLVGSNDAFLMEWEERRKLAWKMEDLYLEIDAESEQLRTEDILEIAENIVVYRE